MLNRRSFFAAICAAPAAAASLPQTTRGPSADLAPSSDLLRSFDARVWANSFVGHVKSNPAIATDEETMTTWFANALMRGWDESQHRRFNEVNQAGAEHIKLLAEDAIGGAVARGWCSPENSAKEFDGDLAGAITEQVMQLAPSHGTLACQRAGYDDAVDFLQRINSRVIDDNCKLAAENEHLRDFRDRYGSTTAAGNAPNR